MKTDDFIRLLATQNEVVPTYPFTQRLALGLALSMVASVVLMLVIFGIRPDLLQVLHQPMLWVKWLVPATVACIGWVLVGRLAQPGVPMGKVAALLTLPCAVLLALTMRELHQTPLASWPKLVTGIDWQACAISIVGLSVPVLCGSMWVLKRMAPTRPALAGTCAGLLSGGVATWVYAFHCPELHATYLIVWNGLGMALCALLGCLVGQKWLRW
jgi:hypothetical protein